MYSSPWKKSAAYNIFLSITLTSACVGMIQVNFEASSFQERSVLVLGYFLLTGQHQHRQVEPLAEVWVVARQDHASTRRTRPSLPMTFFTF